MMTRLRDHINRLCEAYNIPNKGIAPEFLRTLTDYDWPGNIRELVHALESAVTADPGNPLLFAKHLPSYIRAAVARGLFQVEAASDSLSGQPSLSGGQLPQLKDLREKSIEALEHEYLIKLMAQSGGDVKVACRVSGLGRARLYEMLKKYGVTRAPDSPA
ncbi:MAG: helix-turn-helix domain-containing protein [Syntrophobacteraceae bacterium]